MSDTNERYFDATIKKVEIIAPRFEDMGADAFEIVFTVTEDETGKDAEVSLEVSGRYGQGTLGNKKQSEITVDSLKSLGYKHDCDFSSVDELVGSACRIRAKMNAKGTRMNYYFTQNKREALSSEELAKRTAKIMGQMKSASHAPAKATAPAPDPFGATDDDDNTPF
jgi:hypothetical protein